MSRAKLVLSSLTVLLLVVVIGAPLVAQDATATPAASTGATGTLTSCDSSLILLAGLAERYFGYTATDVDMTTFEHGQFTPLFDMSGMQPGMMTTAEPMATMEAMSTVEPMSTSDASMATVEPMATSDASMMSSVMLNPPVIADENPSCTQLRTSLETFFAGKMADPNWDMNFRNGMGMDASGG